MDREENERKYNGAIALLYLFTPCMECCGHAEIVYSFQWIEKKVMKGSIMAQ